MGLLDFLRDLIFGPEPPSRDSGPGAPARSSGGGSVSSGGRQQQPAPSRVRQLLNLDLGPLQPMDDDQVMAGAKGLRWTMWSWNARDRIPERSDKRARLIEQGMLGRGLITTERLEYMHDVGAEYDKVRPRWQELHQLARDAQQAAKEDRARLKAQKKAEAAERKRLRAEAVAERKRTQIDFLGRGVSRGLSDTRLNPERLQEHGLPLLATAPDIAAALGITISQLRWLAYHSDAAQVSHYAYFTVPKKSGGERQLASPQPVLAAAQQWILTNILAKVPLHDAAHGFVPGRSTLTNAQPHTSQALVVNCDLTDFFPSITFPRVRGVFRQLGYSSAAATVLALLCTESPRQQVSYAGQTYWVASGPRALPQGACTSPALSNLAARRLDSRLQGLATKLGWVYTRYADDLTLSCTDGGDDKIGYILARIRHICSHEGFAVNEAKTRVQRRHSQQSVTGLVVNDRPNVPRRTIRRIRAILHQAKSTGLAAQNRESHPNFRGWLQGMIAYIHMANPQQGQQLFRDLALVLEREA